MKKKAAWLTCGAVLALAGGVIFLAVSCGSSHPSYRSVMSQDGEDTLREESIFSLPTADYKIRDGKLYLRVQTQAGLIFLMTVTPDDWNADKIAAFRRAHPELEEYWPDNERPDGGVKWLRK